jgi:hypothetical protein
VLAQNHCTVSAESLHCERRIIALCERRVIAPQCAQQTNAPQMGCLLQLPICLHTSQHVLYVHARAHTHTQHTHIQTQKHVHTQTHTNKLQAAARLIHLLLASRALLTCVSMVPDNTWLFLCTSTKEINKYKGYQQVQRILTGTKEIDKYKGDRQVQGDRQVH